jgi:hypothetical protein
MARPNHQGDSSGTFNRMCKELFKELGMRIPYDALSEIRRIYRKRRANGKAGAGNTEHKMVLKILLAIRDGMEWQHAYSYNIEYIVPFSQGGIDNLNNVRLSTKMR